MGNITRISNHLLKLARSREDIKALLDAVPSWSSFTETYLSTRNSLETRNLGGYRPASSIDSIEDIDLPSDPPNFKNPAAKYSSFLNENSEELEEPE
jgi:hypothetical protein